MSNKGTLITNNSKITTNNTDLSTILEAINNLPEAGSGGSGTMLTGGSLMWQYDAETDKNITIFWGNLEAGKVYEVWMCMGPDAMQVGVFGTDWVDSGLDYQYIEGTPITTELPFNISLTDIKTLMGGIFEEMAFDGIQLTISGTGADMTEDLTGVYWYIKEA